MTIITSKDNTAVKSLKRQLDKPKRSDETMVLEGIHLAQSLIESGGQAQRGWVAQTAMTHPEISAILAKLSCPVMVLSDVLFRSLSTLVQGESILLEVKKSLAQVTEERVNALLLDGVQDAGNLGSILRSASAAGVRTVYLNNACVNPYSPKVLRAGVGAHFSLQIVDGVDLLDIIQALQANGVAVLATSLTASTSIDEIDLTSPVAWLFGSEGSGVSTELIEAASQTVIIPMAAGESLNVAAAAAVCVFETARQQRTRSQ